MSCLKSPKSSATHSPTSFVFDEFLQHPDTPHNNLSYASSPLSTSIDSRSPIPENNEDIISGPPWEQLVFTEDPHPQTSLSRLNGSGDNKSNDDAKHFRPSLTIDTSIIVPPRFITTKGVTDPTGQYHPLIASVRGPGSGKTDVSLKGGMYGIAATNNSPNITPSQQPLSCLGVTRMDLVLRDESRQLSMRQDSGTSTNTTNPSPLTNSSTEAPHEGRRAEAHKSSSDGSLNKRRPTRSATGLNFRDWFHLHRVTFVIPHYNSEHLPHTRRSSSVDFKRDSQNQEQSPQPKTEIQEISRQVWGMAAETGAGLKSRRLSLNLPGDRDLDVIELYNLYAEQSKLLGRHGKSVGKGATANVRLVHKKGAHGGELYAAKEFRGKSSNEKTEEYDKKVKSEYCIAKSVHHPNIVETFRLCTHHGRWIQVMEFCEQGDLFSLVNRKYLAKDDHLADRLCLFKQLVQGLNYLHNNGIAHRDVKLENLLLTRQSKLKITDFGVSEVFSGLHPGLKKAGGQCGRDMGEIRLCAPGMCGSPPYIAPEVISKQAEYDPRPLDVWGAAVVMLCMCANGCLWEKAVVGTSPIYDSLVNGWAKWNSNHSNGSGITEIDYPRVNFFDSHINPPALRRLLLTMLNPDPSQRVTMAGVANNRWIKIIECCQSDSFQSEPVEIDASKSPASAQKIVKVIHHNHQPPHTPAGHRQGLPHGSADK